MFRFWLCFALCPLAIYSQTRDLRLDNKAEFQKGTKVALVVGVGAYPEDSGLSQLKYPASDAQALAAELERQGYAVRKLLDANATRPIVRKLLNDLGQTVDPNQGSFLFYFAGHGYSQDGVNYLATYGVAADDLKGDGLAIPDVEALLKQSKAKRQIVIVDACRSVPRTGSRDATQRTFADLKTAEGMRALYATRAGGLSYESEDLRHGVFTYFLVEGLAGQAANPQDGLVTFRDLSDYVIAKVKAYGVKAGKIQVPFEAGESSGDFLLSAPPARPAPPPVTETAANIPQISRPVNPPPVITPQVTPVHPPEGQKAHAGRDGLKYVLVPSGRFDMGCSPADRGCSSNEQPRHPVTLTKNFWLGQTEVTVGAYKRFIKATGGEMPDSTEINRGWKDEQQPMIQVEFSDAMNYCRWAGGRLPTEAEWEYAARGGTTQRHYGELEDIAWTADNSNDKLHPVAQKQANAYGLFDMLGSVWEWTSDWYQDKYDSATEVVDPHGPPQGEYRVVRGSSFDFEAHIARASDRGKSRSDNSANNLGFRCLLE